MITNSKNNFTGTKIDSTTGIKKNIDILVNKLTNNYTPHYNNDQNFSETGQAWISF